VSNPTHTETWRAVPGYEGLYEVSDHGRVRSLDREVLFKDGHVRRYKGRVLRASLNTKGRPCVGLTRDGKGRTLRVHCLVAAAFIGPRPEGYEVCHNDGTRTNNHVSNLRYDTPKANQADRVEHGTHNRGERHGMAKLSWSDVREIRALYATGRYTQKELADRYDVTYNTVNRIVRFNTWTHDPLETP
jgi:hypothetical protein